MQVFTEKDLASRKPQFMRVICDGVAYDIQPMHVSIDALHRRKSAGRAPEHAHDVYHVVLYGRSSGRFSLCGQLIPAKHGTLAMASPGEKHLFPPAEKGFTIYSEFTFSYLSANGKSLSKPFYELLSMHSGVDIDAWKNIHVLDQDQYDELHGILMRIAELKETSDSLRFLQFYRNIAVLFNFLSVLCFSRVLPQEDSLAAGLARARDFMHSNYEHDIMIGSLAKIACVSKGHFQREFRRKFGLAPTSYMNLYRISVAKNLLRTTPMSCAEIAGKTGFKDIFYFSKVFKRFAGMNSAAYRKKRL